MANLNVTYQEMHDAASQLDNGEQTINGDLQRLQTLISNLVANGFVTDQASKAFDQSYSDFTHGATQMIHGLNGMSQYLNKAASAMQDTDTQLASAIRGS